MQLDFKKTEYFLRVAKTLSYSAAAKELFISTQALHKQIQRLEQELGQPLLHYQGKRLRLTEFGAFYRNACQPVYAAAQKAQIQVDGWLQGQAQTVNVGFFRGLPKEGLVLPVVHYLAAQRPSSNIHIASGELLEMLDLLRSGKIDLCLTNRHDFEQLQEFEQVVFFCNPAQIVVSLYHPWVVREQITEEDIAQAAMLFIKQENDMEQDSFYRHVQVGERVVCDSFDALLANLEKGRHFAVFPRMFEGMGWSRLKYYSLPPRYAFGFETVALYRADNKYARWFASLQDFAAELGG